MSTESSNSDFGLNRINFFLILALLTTMGILIRIYSYANYPPISTQYTPNIEYAPWYIVQNGHLFQSSDIPTVSSYTSGVVYGAVDFIHTFLHSILLIVLGFETFEEIGRFYRLFPWQITILFPIISLTVYNFIAKTTEIRPNRTDQCLIYILSMGPTYNMVVWSITGGLSLIYGWGILFILFYLLFKLKSNDSNKILITGLYILFLLILQPTYHTIALAYSCILLSILVVPIMLGTKDKFVNLSQFGLYIVIFLAFLIYHATSFWGSYMNGLKYFHSLYVKNENPLAPLIKPIEDWWLILQLINYILIATPIFIFIYRKYKKKHPYSLFENYLFYWTSSLVFLSFIFFVWNGVSGVVARINQFGSLISIITFSYLLVVSQNEKVLKFVLKFAIISIVLIANFSYLYSNAAIGNSLTIQEWDGELWVNKYISNENVLFSDFRISTPFVYLDFFKVVGISGSRTFSQKEQLTNIFYADDEKKTISSLLSITTNQNEQIDYLFLSQQMTKSVPTILLPSGYYKPAPENFMDKYSRSKSLNKVYENGGISLFSFISN